MNARSVVGLVALALATIGAVIGTPIAQTHDVTGVALDRGTDVQPWTVTHSTTVSR
jgi:hypothetical protein